MNTSEEDYKIVSELFRQIAVDNGYVFFLNPDTQFASITVDVGRHDLKMCYIFGNRRVFIDDGYKIDWLDISNRDNLRERIEHYISVWSETTK